MVERWARRYGRARWFYLVAVIVIIAGLLAMHSLSIEEDQAGTVVSAAAVEVSAVTDGVLISDAVSPSCDDTICGSSHAVNAVTCLLALLTLLMLVLPARAGWTSVLRWLRSVAGRSAAFASGPPSFRPSLIVLSISRT